MKEAEKSIRISEGVIERTRKAASSVWGDELTDPQMVRAVLEDWIRVGQDVKYLRRLLKMEDRLRALERRPVARGDLPSSPCATGLAELSDPVVANRLKSAVFMVPTAEEVRTREHPIKGRPSAEQIKKEAAKMLAALKLSRWCFGMIKPEYLLGWRPGQTFDLHVYEENGFPLARPLSRYTLEDPGFCKLLVHVATTSAVDPLHLYLYGDRIITVDGVARLAAIAITRLFLPGFLKQVPFFCYRDTRPAIQQSMIVKNINNGPRTLTQEEFLDAVERHCDMWDDADMPQSRSYDLFARSSENES